MKKLYFFVSMAMLLCLARVPAAFAQQPTVCDQLMHVNAEWQNQHDVDKSLRQEPAQRLSEKEMIQLHLEETEQLLRARPVSHLSETQKQNRNKLLAILHDYWQNGVFPVNAQHYNTQPYFIDKYDTHCAVGFLLKESGAANVAKEINQLQQYSYLQEIHHPALMQWVQQSGLSIDELALIQPGYPGDRPTRILECHYNNTGADVNEYIEFQQPVGLWGVPVTEVKFYTENGVLYKTVPLSEMQALPGGVYAYTFPAGSSFADQGRFELTNGNNIAQSIKYNGDSVVITSNIYMEIVDKYLVGENESTPVGSSLSFCGNTMSGNNLTLNNMPATPGVVSSCLILPIALSDFNYTTNASNIILNWKLAAPSAGGTFEVERSNNGTDFIQIGKVLVKPGNEKYTFTDREPQYINHYRIKEIEPDGKYSYSKLLYVKVQKASPLTLIPTVVKDDLRVNINKPLSGNATITVFDLSGRLVMQSTMRNNNQQLNVSALQAGKYVLKVQMAKDEVYQVQFLKL